jgi:hypothetical protein
MLALGLGYVVANARQDRRETTIAAGRTRKQPGDSPVNPVSASQALSIRKGADGRDPEGMPPMRRRKPGP